MCVCDLLRSWILLQTTIMAVEYEGGVILGADSRTTTGESIEIFGDRFRIMYLRFIYLSHLFDLTFI